MPKIELLSIGCNDPYAQRRFYCEILGMKEYEDGTVGYGYEDAKILFTKAEGVYQPRENDLYWKTSIAVPNIELAYQQLTDRGVEVNHPSQFEDVCFQAHFSDPEGFKIELIDHWFKGNRQHGSMHSKLLGGGAHLNLLTFRTANIENIRVACKSWRMKLLSIQPVESKGFTLYFWAFTSDVPPIADPYSVENREWLYQRKYTILEVQHVHSAQTMVGPTAKQAGYAGTTFSGLIDTQDNELMVNMLSRS